MIEPLEDVVGAVDAVKSWPREVRLPLYSALSGLSPWSVCVVPHMDQLNAERMIAHRIQHAKILGVFQIPLVPDRAAVRQFELVGQRFVDAFVDRYGFVEPLARERVLDHAPVDKLAIYRQALHSLEHEKPFSDNDLKDEAHGKIEKRMEYGMPALGGLVGVPDSMAARPVRAKPTRFNIEWARYVYAIERKVYELIDAMFYQRQRLWGRPRHKTVMKGLNANARGVEIQLMSLQHFVVFLGPDAEKWDFSVSTLLLKVEHGIYRNLFPQDARKRGLLLRLLKAMETRKVVVRFVNGVMVLMGVGQRSSGVTNTSLGNIMLMCLMMYDYFQTLPYWADLIDDGDDTIVAVDAANQVGFLAGLQAYFRALGISIKVGAAVPLMQRLTFCQCRLLNLTAGPRMIRIFPEAIAKDTVVLHNYGRKQFFRHLLAVGYCGLAINSGVPVFQEFYLMLIKWARRAGVHNTSLRFLDEFAALRHLSLGMQSRVSDVTEQNRLEFATAFGFGIQHQLDLEARYSRLNFVYEQPFVSGDVLSGAERVDPLLSTWRP